MHRQAWKAKIVEDDVKLTSEKWQTMRDVSCQAFNMHKYASLTCSRMGARCPCAAGVDMIRFGSFGEAYVSSLHGTRALLRALRVHGIRGCRDQTFNLLLNVTVGRKIVVRSGDLKVRTNDGNTLRSPALLAHESFLLQTATRARRLGF